MGVDLFKVTPGVNIGKNLCIMFLLWSLALQLAIENGLIFSLSVFFDLWYLLCEWCISGVFIKVNDRAKAKL